jgi:hypothetical protein
MPILVSSDLDATRPGSATLAVWNNGFIVHILCQTKKIDAVKDKNIELLKFSTTYVYIWKFGPTLHICAV